MRFPVFVSAQLAVMAVFPVAAVYLGFGGYKTLLELLTLYGEIIVLIAILWVVWSLGLRWLHAGASAKALPLVDNAQLCAVFKVEETALLNARASQKVTVHFDDHAVITSIDYAGKE